MDGTSPAAEAVLQEWEGYVTRVADGSFECRLVDVSSGDDLETAEAEIPVANVPEAERHLVRPGAYFRWTIRGVPGGEAGTSRLDFASTPCWTEAEIDAARERGRALADAIRWE